MKQWVKNLIKSIDRDADEKLAAINFVKHDTKISIVFEKVLDKGALRYRLISASAPSRKLISEDYINRDYAAYFCNPDKLIVKFITDDGWTTQLMRTYSYNELLPQVVFELLCERLTKAQVALDTFYAEVSKIDISELNKTYIFVDGHVMEMNKW